MDRKKYNLSGASALFAAAFVYATFGILVRVMSEMWGNNAQVAIRLFIAFLVAAGLLALQGKKDQTLISRQKLPYVVSLGVTFSLVVIFYTYSVRETTIANSVFTLYAGSIVTSFLIGTFLFKEKTTKLKTIAILLALAGLSVYSQAIFAASAGIIYGVLSGIFDGISNSLRKPLAGINRFAVLRLQYAIGAAFATTILLVSRESVINTASLRGVGVTLLYGTLLVVLGNLLLFGFQHFDVNVGTVILSTELAFATLFGILFYKENPSIHELIGGLLIFAASILSSVEPHFLVGLLQRARNTTASRPGR